MVHDLQPHVTSMALGVLRLLRPYTLIGAEKIRVGRFFDGGYVMLDRFKGIEAAYSLGINEDVSWDLDMARLGIPLFQYDPTIAELPQQHPLFNWEPTWIGGEVDEQKGVETLDRLIVKNGHVGNRNLLLKCDIEGAEWPMLQNISNSVLAQFRQIVIEIHNFGFLAEYHHAENVRKAILNLTSSHHVIHVHANNFAPFVVVGGIPVPAVLELTLVRSDEGDFVPSTEIFPTALDMPCHSSEADLYLGRFTFD